jgi:hypothetical protein
MSAQPRHPDGLAVALTIDERERLNEWATEVGISAAELARRLILRYLQPPRDRDAVDERIGQTLMARAGAMGHIPDDASEQIGEIIAALKRADSEPGKLGGA